MNEIVWTRRALKQLMSIDQRYIHRIKNKVSKLSDFPDVDLDIKKISGESNQFRLRVGIYRILFDVIDGKPVIINIQAVMRRTSTTY